jgi:hypothetical protein
MTRASAGTVGAASLTVGIAYLGACLGACSGINSQTNAYATLEEARQAGAIERGWLPDGLPAGTYDIREAHVPNSRERWGIVNFPPSQGDALKALFEPTEIPLTGLRCNPPPRIEWWPVALRGELDGERLSITHLQAYRARAGGLLFAVNWNQGRAYYWTPPGD